MTMIFDQAPLEGVDVGSMNGVAIGVVTQNQDDQGWGRVKVRFPWSAQSDESYWARLATLLAGPDYGSFFVPDVGAEVLVAFDGGRIEHPYVLGMLWNGSERPPVASVERENPLRQITSRDKHQIVFKDEAGGGIHIHTANEARKVHVDDAGIEVSDSSGNQVVIQSKEGQMTIESTTALNIRSTTVNVEATADLSLTAKGMVKIQGQLVKIN